MGVGGCYGLEGLLGGTAKPKQTDKNSGKSSWRAKETKTSGQGSEKKRVEGERGKG